jgi:hypothetical protein
VISSGIGVSTSSGRSRQRPLSASRSIRAIATDSSELAT